MADPIFSHPRLAALYDLFDADRSDLDAYESMVGKLGATSVLDVGCGTGTFACRLAAKGITVTGLEPAPASLAIAQSKPGADNVRWICGTVADLPPLTVDLVTMTANVAQVFLTDDDWLQTLLGIREVLGPKGRLVFETRNPVTQAWRDWTREKTFTQVELANEERVQGWVEVTNVQEPLVSFRWTYVFQSDGAVLTSDSTLRFRTLGDITASLHAAGLQLEAVREAPDRLGREFVLIAYSSPK